MRTAITQDWVMFRIIRASFNQRRKTLANSLNNSPELFFPKEQIQEAIAALDVSPSVRGEALSLEQFAQLANLLSKKRVQVSEEEKA